MSVEVTIDEVIEVVLLAGEVDEVTTLTVTLSEV